MELLNERLTAQPWIYDMDINLQQKVMYIDS